jgi:hypothetical protein
MTKKEILDALLAAHREAEGTGDQGAFKVWNKAVEILIAEHKL